MFTAPRRERRIFLIPETVVKFRGSTPQEAPKGRQTEPAEARILFVLRIQNTPKRGKRSPQKHGFSSCCASRRHPQGGKRSQPKHGFSSCCASRRHPREANGTRQSMDSLCFPHPERTQRTARFAARLDGAWMRPVRGLPTADARAPKNWKAGPPSELASLLNKFG